MMMRRASLAALAFLGACGGPSSRDYREDRRALVRVLTADATTAERMDPVLAMVGTEEDATSAIARLEGEVRAAARRAEGLARAVRAKTPEGRALRGEVLEAMEDRGALVAALARAARSGEAAEALEAIRAARELEERLVDIEARITALSRDD
jgi:hypothetical protein